MHTRQRSSLYPDSPRDRAFPAPARPVSGVQVGPWPLRYRPSPRGAIAYWRRPLLGLATLTVLVIAMLFILASTEGISNPARVMAGLVAAVDLGYLGAALLYLRTLSMTVDAGAVTRRVFGTARRIPRTELQRAVRTTYTQPLARAVPILLFLDPRGRTRLRLNPRVWAAADLQALVSELGLKEVTPAGGWRPKDLQREFPGAMPWTAVHPAATALLTHGILLVVLGILARLGLSGF